jgi:hypothetical protein
MGWFEMLGRYAEDPMVYVEAESAEAAAEFAVVSGMAVRPGYRPGGSLIPTPVAAPPEGYGEGWR